MNIFGMIFNNKLSIVEALLAICPKLEVILRKFYWKNIKVISKFSANSINKKPVNKKGNFDNVLKFLRNNGIVNGKIIIVHSSYDNLLKFNLSPEEIIEKLISLIGNEGTLVMPAIRKYKEEGKKNEYLSKDLANVICKYDVKKTPVKSGLLPYILMQYEESKISQFPLNPVVAIGKNAKNMISNNLIGNPYPSPHGLNSAWKYCADNNAIVIGLGVEMPKYLTITHVHEENHSNWPIKNWYRTRKFIIKDNSVQFEQFVNERDPKWGTMYFCEKRYKYDLIKNNILIQTMIDNTEISIVPSNELMRFLQNQSQLGYPYKFNSNLLK